MRIDFQGGERAKCIWIIEPFVKPCNHFFYIVSTEFISGLRKLFYVHEIHPRRKDLKRYLLTDMGVYDIKFAANDMVSF